MLWGNFKPLDGDTLFIRASLIENRSVLAESASKQRLIVNSSVRMTACITYFYCHGWPRFCLNVLLIYGLN